MNKCPICELEDRYNLETQVLKGKMTKRDLAEHAKCEVAQAYEHMTSHLINSQLQDVESKRNILITSINRLNDNLEALTYSDSMSPAQTKQIVQLAAEVRKSIMDLNALEGNSPAEQHITIEQYNDFRSVIVTKMTKVFPKLCPSCQTLWSNMIEELDEQPVIEIES